MGLKTEEARASIGKKAERDESGPRTAGEVILERLRARHNTDTAGMEWRGGMVTDRAGGGGGGVRQRRAHGARSRRDALAW